MKRPTGSLRVKRGVDGRIWCEMGERVFIWPESSRRLVLRAYVRHYFIAVQRLSCTSRYYLEDIPKSSVRPILLGVRPCTIHKVRRTIFQRMSSGPPVYVCEKRKERTSANPSVLPP
jgi:hypothetical protein